MPLVYLEPVQPAKMRSMADCYSCQLHKASACAGVPSTTRHSMNFVAYLQLLRAGWGQAHSAPLGDAWRLATGVGEHGLLLVLTPLIHLGPAEPASMRSMAE